MDSHFDIQTFAAEAVRRCSHGVQGEVPLYNDLCTKVTSDVLNAERVHDVSSCVLNDVTAAVGNTPLVKLSRLAAAYNVRCQLLAKVELTSIGGSVKDRIARRMIEEAEAKQLISKGDVIVEASSGNTGIGLAVICAVKGYRLAVVMPRKMSMEKENVLVALGVTVIRTRSTAYFTDPDSHVATAYMLRAVINEHTAETGVKAVCSDQFLNTGNINAHYYETAVELLNQTDRKITAFVATAGTGGTISGVGERLKAELPDVKIVGVDPDGSMMSAAPGTVNRADVVHPYELEGIGHDFYPPVFHHSVVDSWIKCNDKGSFRLAREVMQLEGILCGATAGAALYGALEVAKRLSEDDTVVVLFPDSIRNYLSKYVSDDWMLLHGIFDCYKEHRAYKPVPVPPEMTTFNNLVKTFKLSKSMLIVDALRSLQLNRYDFGVVINDDTSDYNLLAVHSREEFSVWYLEGRGEQRIDEVADPHTIYPFNNEEGLTADNLGEARLALLAQAKAGGASILTIIPKPFISVVESAEGLRGKRKALCSQNYSSVDILVLTKLSYLKTLKLSE